MMNKANKIVTEMNKFNKLGIQDWKHQATHT